MDEQEYDEEDLEKQELEEGASNLVNGIGTGVSNASNMFFNNNKKTSNNLPQEPAQNNNGLATGNGTSPAPEGPELKKDNQNNNKSSDDKDKKDKNDKKENKDNKDKKDNNKEKKDSNEKDNKSSDGKKIDPKKIAGGLGKKALSSIGSGISKLGGGNNGEGSEEQQELKKVGQGITAFIAFIVSLGWVAIIIAAIIIGVLFVIILISTTSGTFGSDNYGDLMCLMRTPVEGSDAKVTSFFGWRIFRGSGDPHTGIDIETNEGKGTPVYAAHDGTISYGYEQAMDGEYGRVLKIEYTTEFDNKTYQTTYSHICDYETEEEQKQACEASGDTTGYCSDLCQINDEGKYEYQWKCSDISSLDSKYVTGTAVKAGDLIGYISETGSRCDTCDNHLHYEIQSKSTNKTEYVAIDKINRYFYIEMSSKGCDPLDGTWAYKYYTSGILPSNTDIIKRKCMIPDSIIVKEDDMFNYCPQDLPGEITPEEKRYQGTVSEEIKKLMEEGLTPTGTYSANVCNYEAEQQNGKFLQCAAGIYQYYNSFLPTADPDAWSKYRKIYGNAEDYWYKNLALGKDGFAVTTTPKVGSIWASTAGTYGHVMTVTGVSGNNVTVYECNGFTNKKCGTYEYTAEDLSGKDGFQGYINILNDEACQ